MDLPDQLAALTSALLHAHSQDEMEQITARVGRAPGMDPQSLEDRCLNAVASAFLAGATPPDQVAAERMRIAQTLHDQVAQTLFAMGMMADWVSSHLESDQHLKPELEQVKSLAAKSLCQVREAIFTLSACPVQGHELVGAVDDLLKELERSGVAARLQTSGDLDGLAPTVTETLFQVIREAVVNVWRHARATAAQVTLRVDGGAVTAVVQDDGVGMPPGVLETYRESGAHLGLRSMDARLRRLGGRLTLAPGEPKGLVVTAVLPTTLSVSFA